MPHFGTFTVKTNTGETLWAFEFSCRRREKTSEFEVDAHGKRSRNDLFSQTSFRLLLKLSKNENERDNLEQLKGCGLERNGAAFVGCCYLTYHNFPVLFSLDGAVFHFLNFYPVRRAPFLLEQPFLRPGHDVSVFSALLITHFIRDILLAPGQQIMQVQSLDMKESSLHMSL